MDKSLEKDWQRLIKKEKFVSMISRENKSFREAGGGMDESMLKDIYKVL